MNDNRMALYFASWPFHFSPHRHVYAGTDTLHPRPTLNSDPVSNQHSSRKPLPVPPPIPEPNSLSSTSPNVASLRLYDSRTAHVNHESRRTSRLQMDRSHRTGPDIEYPKIAHLLAVSDQPAQIQNVPECPKMSRNVEFFRSPKLSPQALSRVCHENRLFS